MRRPCKPAVPSSMSCASERWLAAVDGFLCPKAGWWNATVRRRLHDALSRPRAAVQCWMQNAGMLHLAHLPQQGSSVPADGKLLLCSAQGCAQLGSFPCSCLAVGPVLGMLSLEPALHRGQLLLRSFMCLLHQHNELEVQSSQAAKPLAGHRSSCVSFWLPLRWYHPAKCSDGKLHVHLCHFPRHGGARLDQACAAGTSLSEATVKLWHSVCCALGRLLFIDASTVSFTEMRAANMPAMQDRAGACTQSSLDLSHEAFTHSL